MSIDRRQCGVGPLEREELDRLLTKNAGKAARELLTLIRLFEELQALGRCRAGSDAGRMPPLGAPWRWTERPSPSRGDRAEHRPGACAGVDAGSMPARSTSPGGVALPFPESACSLRPAANASPIPLSREVVNALYHDCGSMAVFEGPPSLSRYFHPL